MQAAQGLVMLQSREFLSSALQTPVSAYTLPPLYAFQCPGEHRSSTGNEAGTSVEMDHRIKADRKMWVNVGIASIGESV